MASTKTLNATNLAALGATRLAELLLEITASDPSARRRLRLALAGEGGAGEVAREVQKRLTALERARADIPWNQIKEVAVDLATQRRAITDVIGRTDARLGLELLWRFMFLAEPILQRCDDSNGVIVGIFQAAIESLGGLAIAAKTEPESLSAVVFRAVIASDFGQFDGLIPAMTEALGPSGLASLKRQLIDWGAQTPDRPPDGQRRIIGFGRNGPLFADELEADSRKRRVRSALTEIAEVTGDVDGFIEQYPQDARRAPHIAANIAEKLLAAGRTDEAWAAIEAVDLKRYADSRFERLAGVLFQWEAARLMVMKAQGRNEEAQAFRWACFARSLDPDHLRPYLKALPDFDDVEAEDRAMTLAAAFPDASRALAFLISWPALDRAGALVLARSSELDGDDFELLVRAGDLLEARYPLASSLARRAMIDFALSGNRVKRYAHAARHLAECGALAPRIDDFAGHSDHAAYLRQLQNDHGRKRAFWDHVDNLP